MDDQALGMMILSYPGDKSMVKGKRRSAPKHRTGCKVCKTRRIKCDEIKPRCSQCSRSGWECEYESMIRLAFLTPTSKELKGFIRWTGKELGVHLHVHFWGKVVLQLGENYKPINHLLQAIYTVHDGLRLTPNNSSHPHEIESSFIRRCMVLVNKAIRLLTSETNPPPIHVTILGALLMFTMDRLMYRNAESAIHLRGAHQLYNHINSSGTLKSLGYEERQNLIELQPMMLLTAPMLNEEDRKMRCTFRLADMQDLPCDIPNAFTSVLDAYQVILKIMIIIIRSLSKIQDQFDVVELDAIKRHGLSLLDQWIAMDDAFRKDFMDGQLEYEAYRACSLNKSNTVALQIILQHGSLDETDFDQYIPAFQQIFDHAEPYFRGFRADAKMPSKFFLSADAPTMGPSVWLICRCRDPVLRRKCLSMLNDCVDLVRKPWRLRLLVAVLDLQIQIEEFWHGRVKSAAEISKDHRIRTTGLQYHQDSHQIMITAIQADAPIEYFLPNSKLTECLQGGRVFDDSTPFYSNNDTYTDEERAIEESIWFCEDVLFSPLAEVEQMLQQFTAPPTA